MTIPSWWAALLLTAAAFRTWHLIAFDKVLQRPRFWALGLGWQWQKGDPIPLGYRYELGQFVECFYCFGFWVALAWFGLWEIWPHGMLIVATPFALATGLIALARTLSETE